jgi:peroxiredoxin
MIVLTVMAGLLSGGIARAETVKLRLLSAGAGKQMSAFKAQEMKLSQMQPAGVKKIPEGLTVPLYGVITLGPRENPTTFTVLVDAPAGKPSRLYVDSNADGDLTNDPPPEWQAAPGENGITRSLGGATVQVRYGTETLPLHLTLSRVDQAAPPRAPQFNSVFYSADYAREGEIVLGGKRYSILLSDVLTRGDFRGAGTGIGTGIFLEIDVNHNGKIDSRGEVYLCGNPFNIGGTTYEITKISVSGDTLEVVKSRQSVAEVLPPPDLRVGKKVVPFEKTALEGQKVRFPVDYKGHLVLLYFFGSWCSDCNRELPYVVKAYETYHPQGLEVLGAGMEKPNTTVAQFRAFITEKKMDWPEIFDDKWWKADLAQLYYVQNTPTGYLVDGDTGEILAAGSDLEGDNLNLTLQKALANRKRP